jgi:hypothetical protein
MLCHRGCGLTATYINFKGLGCCSNITQHCPIVKQKIGRKNSIALKGRKASPEQLAGLAKGRNGRIPSAETVEKIRQSNIKTKNGQIIIPWNKGLNLKDPRVESYANKQRGQERANRIKIIPSDDPIYQDFKKYRNRIAVRTKNTYNEFMNEINPNNLPLGKAGVDGAHHIDHIMSVREAFIYNVPIELTSSKENLRIIPWQENNSKYSKVDYNIIPQSIKQYLKENNIKYEKTINLSNSKLQC